MTSIKKELGNPLLARRRRQLQREKTADFGGCVKKKLKFGKAANSPTEPKGTHFIIIYHKIARSQAI